MDLASGLMDLKNESQQIEDLALRDSPLVDLNGPFSENNASNLASAVRLFD